MQSLNRNGVSITQTPGEGKVREIPFGRIQGTDILPIRLPPYGRGTVFDSG